MTVWLAMFLGFSALFFYIVVPHQTTLIYSLSGAALAGALFFAVVHRSELKGAMVSRTGLYGMNTTVLALVFLGILIFINLLSNRHKQRFDLTEGGYYTLAPQTRKIVSTLPRDVKMTAFFQTESSEKTKFKNLADSYLEISDKIELNFVDPDRNPAITKQYGITSYETIVLESGKQETKVKTASEEELTNAFLKVIKDEQKKIYFLEGHGEKTIGDTEKEGYSSAKASLEKDGFKVDKLLLLQSGKIPENARLLVIAGPVKPVHPEEKNILENYLQNGGSLLVLLEPDTQSGMEEFLLRWGVQLRNDFIIDPMSKLFGGDFAAPVVSQFTVHDITKNFQPAVIFPVVRSVSSKPVEGITTTELLLTGPNSWAETDLNATKVKYDENKDRKGPVPIAVVATRELPSEQPENPGESPNGQEDGKQKARKARLVTIGDADFANNAYINFSENGDFFLNTASWLVEEENLISIRPKKRKNNPLQLTQVDGSIIFILGTIVFPSIVAATGIRKWWKRRRL